MTHEEQLQARPVARQTEEVSLRKEVVEEVQTIEVPVRREELRVEGDERLVDESARPDR